MTQRSEIQTVLTADTSNLVKGLNRAKSEGERFKGVMDRVTGSFKSALGGLGVGLGAGALTAGLVSAAKRTLDFAEQIENMSASTGLGGEAIQALSIAAKDSGVSVSLLESQLIKLNEMVNTDKGKEELAKLGITATNSADAIDQLAKAFGNADGSKLAQLTDVLGDKFAKLMPLIAQINESGGLGGLISGKNEAGLIISDENRKQLLEADKIVDGIKNKLTVEIAEGISWWTKQLSDLHGNISTTPHKKISQDILDMNEDSVAHLAGKFVQKVEDLPVDLSLSREEYIKKATAKRSGPQGTIDSNTSVIIEDLLKSKAYWENKVAAEIFKGGFLPVGVWRGLSGTVGDAQAEAQNNADTIQRKIDILKDVMTLAKGEDRDFGADYDKQRQEADAAYQKKLDAAHAILEKGEAERDISDAILSINEQIARKKEEIAKLSDPVENAKAQVQLERLRMNLEKQLAAEQKKKDDAIQDANDKRSKEAEEYVDAVNKMFEDEDIKAKEKNRYEGMKVDEYAKVGKFVGLPKHTEDLQKKANEYLKDIRDDIGNLKGTNYQ